MPIPVNDPKVGNQSQNLLGLLNGLPTDNPAFAGQRADLQSQIDSLTLGSNGDSFVGADNGADSELQAIRNEANGLSQMIGSSNPSPSSMMSTFESAASKAANLAVRAITTGARGAVQLASSLLNLSQNYNTQFNTAVEQFKKDLEAEKKTIEHAKPV